MRWPWKPRETRASFTDSLTAALLARVSGSAAGDPGGLAALETAAGVWARAFAAAQLEPGIPAITPEIMAAIARNLIRYGECVYGLDIADGGLVLLPVASWDVAGNARPATWRYRLNMPGPSRQTTVMAPAEGVLHFRFATDPARPWRGVGPLGFANVGAALAANSELRLSQEASGTVSRLIPIPQDGGDGGDDDPLKMLKADIAGGKGQALMVETTNSGWGDGKTVAPQSDWKQQRIGPDPSDSFRTLHGAACEGVMQACGVPLSLVMANSDGTAQRESWRRFVMGTVEPIARIVAGEIADKLDVPGVRFDFASLWAHDLVGRAQAFMNLVASGTTVAEAATQTGLLADASG